MKKKLLAVILAVASFAALAGCGSNGTTDQKALQKRAIAVQTRTLPLRLEQKALVKAKFWANYMRWHWKMQVIP